MGSYVPATSSEQLEMLEAIGLRDFRELYGDVPEEMYLRAPLDIPEGLSELEVSRKLRAMAAKNHVFSTVLRGAGAYDHYIPSVVSYIPAKEEFLTAYTPYQAEMSQGLLQSIFVAHIFSRPALWRPRRPYLIFHIPSPASVGSAAPCPAVPP